MDSNMGAIAVTKKDAEEITALMRELRAKSKAEVVRAALRSLRGQLDREKLRARIQESVQRCAEADLKENLLLSAGGVARRS
jgi:Arc/MetJ-type ribon-helix-helix transcriptional regulator